GRPRPDRPRREAVGRRRLERRPGRRPPRPQGRAAAHAAGGPHRSVRGPPRRRPGGPRRALTEPRPNLTSPKGAHPMRKLTALLLVAALRGRAAAAPAPPGFSGPSGATSGYGRRSGHTAAVAVVPPAVSLVATPFAYPAVAVPAVAVAAPVVAAPAPVVAAP